MLRVLAVAVFACCGIARCSPQEAGQADSQSGSAQAGSISIDLRAAIERARAYSEQFLSAGFATSLAREDRIQAKAAFYPTLNVLNQYLYTQGNGTPSGVFVANDGVHVYNEQAVVHAELFSVTRKAEYQRAVAAEAAARARQDIALRGLAGAVVQNYYAFAAAERRLENSRRSLEEASRFAEITRRLEAAGEAAHADTVKAQLQFEQHRRELMEADTSAGKARLSLAVMLFADVNQRFTIVDDLQSEAPLPPAQEVRTLALAQNPDIRAAEAALRQSSAAIGAARGAYYPSLAVDYFYGINANVFGIHGPDGRKNLGSVVQGTVTVPVWNWGVTRSRLRQAEVQTRQAEFELAIAKRQVQAAVNGFYLELETARTQVDSLRTSRDLAAESLRLTLLRYEAGEATALEVADAQTTVADARNSYDDGLARYRIAAANVAILTGRL